MDFSYLIDLFLHLDKNLALVANQWGVWIYALLFVIIFVETGLVVMPFLPGDSLLFVAGAIAAVGGLDLFALMALLTTAAVTGDALNYSIGRKIGNRVFSWENSRWFNRNAFDKADAFYEKYGPITIVLGRFMPFIRTFAPFVAGVAHMRYSVFIFYNVVGGILWVCSLSSLGFLIGDHPWVKSNFSLVALAMIVIPGSPALWIFVKEVFNKLSHRSK
ncbi:VTT domain-containing protein [Polynucleobacter necessarius]|uniref:VTT domain-containing protein n=1 Tax=Polynucleobacter necessarius TaxID=576610 RepID=UPI000E099065|nr:VTT domain-containing protein [Polynucleobacter necessarius]